MKHNEVLMDLDEIKQDIKLINEKLIVQTPEHFSKRNILSIFSGALFFGLTFMFKGLLVDIALKLPPENVALIIASTMMILIGQIYFIGYEKVSDKSSRKWGQFVLKRLVASYAIALVVSFYLSFIFGFIFLIGSGISFVKLVIVLAMPCAVGGAIGDLLHKY